MKTFVMKSIGEVEFMEKEVPDPGPNDAVIKTTRALVCTSDVHTVNGGIGERQDLTLGHEAVGIVSNITATATAKALRWSAGRSSAFAKRWALPMWW